MSHAKERTEKNCLNCGQMVAERFCTHCGQENVTVQLGFAAFARHFIYDILHFDGQFFTTLKGLVQRPGRVARNYVDGKRRSYLDPVRMYLFLSTVTFFLFPLVIDVKGSLDNLHIVATPSERLHEIAVVRHRLKSAPANAATERKLDVLLDTSKLLLLKNPGDTAGTAIDFYINGKHFKALPVAFNVVFPERNWFEKKISANMRAAFDAEGGNVNKLVALQNIAQLKMLPYVFFVSLPVFTILLGLLYKRSKRAFSDHAIFTLYHYISGFVLLLLFLLLHLLTRVVPMNAVLFFYLPLTVLWLVYLLIELKTFYGERWGKTFLKFITLTFLSLVTMVILFFCFVVFNLLY